jgi:hypothetical protein
MEKKKDSKGTKGMAGGGRSTKGMAGGGKSTKYMAGGGKSTKYMAGGGKMGTEVGKEQKVQSYKEYVKNMFGGGMTSVPAMKKNKR